MRSRHDLVKVLMESNRQLTSAYDKDCCIMLEIASLCHSFSQRNDRRENFGQTGKNIEVMQENRGRERRRIASLSARFRQRVRMREKRTNTDGNSNVIRRCQRSREQIDRVKNLQLILGCKTRRESRDYSRN